MIIKCYINNLYMTYPITIYKKRLACQKSPDSLFYITRFSRLFTKLLLIINFANYYFYIIYYLNKKGSIMNKDNFKITGQKIDIKDLDRKIIPDKEDAAAKK